MGLYDYLFCEYPLPGNPPNASKIPFETKDLPEYCLAEYHLGKDGCLYLDGQLQDVTDGVNFYHSNVTASGPGTYTSDGEDAEWLEYQALFVHGKLTHLELIKHDKEPAQKRSDAPWVTEFKDEQERMAWWSSERQKFKEWQEAELQRRASIVVTGNQAPE